MADIVDNKHDISTSWGDSDSTQGHLGADNDSDYASDVSGIPKVDSNNKYPVNTGFGDADSTFAASMTDEKEDFARDGSGVPNPPGPEKTEMNMNLAPNMFPRETTTGGLSDDDLVHT